MDRLLHPGELGRVDDGGDGRRQVAGEAEAHRQAHLRAVLLPVQHFGPPELGQFAEPFVEAGFGVEPGHRLDGAGDDLLDLEPHAEPS